MTGEGAGPKQEERHTQLCGSFIKTRAKRRRAFLVDTLVYENRYSPESERLGAFSRIFDWNGGCYETNPNQEKHFVDGDFFRRSRSILRAIEPLR